MPTAVGYFAGSVIYREETTPLQRTVLTLVQQLAARCDQIRKKTLENPFLTFRAPEEWDSYRLQRLQADPSLIDRLDITVTAERMQELYKRYHILVLREPQNTRLLLYCGNRPLECCAMAPYVYSEEGRTEHAHVGWDTLDADILMNPSMITPWPSTGAIEYLSSHHYQVVQGELIGFTNAMDELGIAGLEEGLSILHKLLIPGGRCTTRYPLDHKEKLLFEDIETIAAKHGFFVSMADGAQLIFIKLGSTGEISG